MSGEKRANAGGVDSPQEVWYACLGTPMRNVIADIFSYFRDVDRREMWILTYAVIGMLLFVALSNGGTHPIFEQLFAARFGPGHLDDPNYHWWKITFFHTGVLLAFAVVPVVIVRAALHDQLRAFGLTLGDWRWGLKFLALWCLVMGPGTYFSTNQPDFLAEYPLAHADVTAFGAPALIAWFGIYLLYYIGWEIFFRGFLLFGMRDRFGTFGAIMLQTIPSTIIHIGKPIGETVAAFPGGLILGAAALRTRSIFWPLAAHWLLGCMTELFTAMHRSW